MKTVLVLNTGSSSVKFAVAHGRKIFLRGLIDHFGRQAKLITTYNGRQHHTTMPVADLRAALAVVRQQLSALRLRPDLVAHRIVHGGRKFNKPVQLSPTNLKYLHGLTELAPLHQPANLAGVAWAKKSWPKATQWGVFDTAVFRALPACAKVYALPKSVTQKLQIEKYGFHGTSHAWAFRQAAKKLNLSASKLSAVTIHLGAGSSMTLWCDGKPLDTTMGFTPLAGLVMSTRAGDIDPAMFMPDRLMSSCIGTPINFSDSHSVPGMPRTSWPYWFVVNTPVDWPARIP